MQFLFTGRFSDEIFDEAHETMNNLRNFFCDFDQGFKENGLSSIIVSITAVSSKTGNDITVRRSYSSKENSEIISIVFNYFFWRRLNNSEKIELILNTVLKKVFLIDDLKICRDLKIYILEYINSRLVQNFSQNLN